MARQSTVAGSGTGRVIGVRLLPLGREPFPAPSPSPVPALLILPGWPQSSFHLISMCGRGGTRRVGKQHSHTHTQYNCIRMGELSKHVFSRKGGEGEEEEEKGRPCALPQQCVSRETTRRPPGQLVARVYSFGCSFVAISHSYAPSPTAPLPLPPTLASHACVLYTRMLFHLRKCFFSELCPDGLVRR